MLLYNTYNALPCGVGSSPLLLPRSINVNQGEVLDNLLHFFKLEQWGEAALTCQRAKIWKLKEAHKK